MIKPAISIIVPVYNAEKYLHRCIDSILAQTFYNFELLLINDGSRDNSGIICDEYANEDSRVRVFHSENLGVSAARNIGLKNAYGEWIAFIDSDDWISLTMYEKLYMCAKSSSADIIYCDYYQDFGNREVYEMVDDLNISKLELFKSLLVKGWPVIWNKIYRSEIFKKNNILFLEGCNFCEDLLFTVESFYYSKNNVYINEALYHYNRTNINSLVRTLWTKDKMVKNIQDGIDVIERLILFFKCKDMYNLLEKELAWSLLKAKVGYMYLKEKRQYYFNLYPELNKYIYSNPLTSRKIKILQTCMLFTFLWCMVDVALIFKKK